MNYFDSDMSNSTITVVHFNGKEVGNLLSLRARSHTIYAAQVDCSIFQLVKFEQTCAQVTTGKYLNEATTVTVTVCFARIIYTSHNYY